MKKIVVILAVAEALALAIPVPAHAAPGQPSQPQHNFKLVVNGNTIDQGDSVSCTHTGSDQLDVQATGDSGTTPNTGNARILHGNDVVSVEIQQYTGSRGPEGKFINWTAQPGSRIVKNGDSYTITGTAKDEFKPDSSPVPFEFDYTCERMQ